MGPRSSLKNIMLMSPLGVHWAQAMRDLQTPATPAFQYDEEKEAQAEAKKTWRELVTNFWQKKKSEGEAQRAKRPRF